MKSLLFVLLFSWLQPFLMGQDCGSSVSTFYDCMLNGLKATPEEDAMMDSAMACFKDNSCKNPEELKSCVMNNVKTTAVPSLQTCMQNHTDLPLLDFDKLKSIRIPFAAAGLMKKPDVVRTILGKLCNGNTNNANQVQNCIMTMMNASGGMMDASDGMMEGHGKMNASHWKMEGHGNMNASHGKMDGHGNMNASHGKMHGGRGGHFPAGIFSKFANIKTCWTALPKPCRQKLISAKSALCCCASQVNLKSKIKDAAGTCGISGDDFNMAAGQMGSLIEKFCGNPHCSANGF